MNRYAFFHTLERKLHRHGILEDKVSFDPRFDLAAHVGGKFLWVRGNYRHAVEMAKQKIGLAIRPQLTTEVGKLLGNFAFDLSVLHIFTFHKQYTGAISLPRKYVNIAEHFQAPKPVRRTFAEQLRDRNFRVDVPAQFVHAFGDLLAEIASDLVT